MECPFNFEAATCSAGVSADSLTAAWRATQPPKHGRFWHLSRALRDPLQYLNGLACQGPFVTIREGKTYLVNEPEFIKHVLQDNHPNYAKGPLYRRALQPLIGNGLPSSEGAFWLRQRRMMQPAFLKQHHEKFASTIVSRTEQTIAAWRKAAAAQSPIDVRKHMMNLSLGILLKTVFGREPAEEVDPVGRAFLAIQNEINLVSVFNPIQIPDFVPTPRRLRLNAAYRVIHPFIQRIVDDRRRGGANEEDLASLLVFARDDGSEGMDDVQLRDEIMTIIATGHDSVTEALTWALYLLACHPDVSNRLAAEGIAVTANEKPSAESLCRLPYTAMVIQETLRLYPPIWGLMRQATNPDVIGGHHIPAGAKVVTSPFSVHRLPHLWHAPEHFWPERFAPEHSVNRHRFAYFPFGAGPRQCLGGSFALLEMPIVLAMLVSAFEFELNDIGPVRPLPRVTLKPDRRILLTVRERRTGFAQSAMV
jgi:cytochrome P450